MKNYTIQLNAGEYGFFETEWYNSFLKTERREDLDPDIKKVMCSMYASLLSQLDKQSLEFYKNKKDNNLYDEFYTEEMVNKFIKLYEETLKKYKEYIK